MKKIFFVIQLFIPLLFFNAIGQDLLWTSHFTGTGKNDPKKCVIDTSNYLYVVGEFTGTVNHGDSSLTASGAQTDIFIGKYDNDGVVQWLRGIGGTAKEWGPSIALCPDQSGVIVAGTFIGTCNFDDSTLISTDGPDMFLAKYNSDGQIQWLTKAATGSGNKPQRPNNIEIDANGEIVVTGFYMDTLIIGPYSFTGRSGIVHPFIAKYNSSGSPLWVTTLDSDNSGNRLYSFGSTDDAYYFGGTFKGTLYLDIETLNSNNASADMFLYKTDYSGNGDWVRKIAGDDEDYGQSVVVDDNDKIYINGYYKSTSLIVDSTATDTSQRTFGNLGNNDLFFAKYATDGELEWANAEGSTGDDRLNFSYTNTGNLIISGWFGGQIDFKGEEINPVGGEDMLGLVYDSYDNLIYIVHPGGDLNEEGWTCTIDKEGNFIFIGSFYSDTVFFGDNGFLENADAGGTTTDMFIAKYDKMSIDMVATEPGCYGGSDGSISVTPRGIGEEPFSYAWDHGPTTQNVSNLSSGWYTVTVTDNTGYVVFDSAFVDNPDSIYIVLTNTDSVSCYNGSDGYIDVTTAGGTGGYTYAWSATAGGSGLEPTQEDQFVLGIGTYKVLVRDNNFCYDSIEDIMIHQPTPIALSAVVTDVSVQGADDGEIDLTVTGGTPPYTYLWSNDSTTEDLTNLAGGDYDVTVTDDNLCVKDTQNIFVYEPDVLLVTGTVTDVTCFGDCDGSIDVTVTGGTPGYLYVWKIQGQPDTIFQGQDPSGLCAETYVVYVTDAAFTEVSKVFIVDEPSELSLSLIPTHITCKDLGDGSINATIIGGTPPYESRWYKSGTPGLYATTEDITGLSPGTYIDTVFDANGCFKTASTPITEPPALAFADVDITDVSCYEGKNDGSICLTISGGTPGYTYLWSNGKTTSCITLQPAATYSCTVKDTNNCPLDDSWSIDRPPAIDLSDKDITKISCYGLADGIGIVNATGGTGVKTIEWSGPISGTGATLDSMLIGLYYITATDENDCEEKDTVTMTQPDSITIGILSQQNLDCVGDADGYIQINASGGNGEYPYDYWWSTLDGSGIVPTDKNQSGLTAGTYKVEVSDWKNCEDSLSIDITEPANGVSVIRKLSGHVDVLCYGGSSGEIALSGSGGTQPYEYSLNRSDWQTDSTFTGLSANSYICWIRDANLCESSTSDTVDQPDAITLDSVRVTDASSPGATDGTITLYLSGGTDTLYFTLTPGDIENIIGIFTGLLAGDYTITVMDVNECEASVDTAVGEPDNIQRLESGNYILVYPNPTPGLFNIQFQQINTNRAFIEIVNLNGQVVYEKLFERINKEPVISIDLSNQPKGLYILKVDGHYVETVIILE